MVTPTNPDGVASGLPRLSEAAIAEAKEPLLTQLVGDPLPKCTKVTFVSSVRATIAKMEQRLVDYEILAAT